MRALTGLHAVLVAGLVAVLAAGPAPAAAAAAAANQATTKATTEATHLATQPPPGPFGTPNYQAALTGGDVRIVGNSVLRCPRDDEDRHHAGTSSDCHQATHLAIDDPRDPPNNDGYHMKIADVDGDGATITSSSAMLAIPPRSVVTYAQLTWGGHTGVYTGRNRLYCTDPDTGDGSAARTRFDTTPSTQPVTLTVDGRRAVLDPAHYTTSLDPGSDTEMYTGWQDVTGHLADLPAGSQVRVTVADVWAVYGFGCTAGWTLTVVYSTFGSPTMRTIDVYTDHFRKAEHGDDTVALRGLNVRPNQAAVNLGVTGLQGDRDYHDRLQVAGQAVANPCLFLAYHDFFSSCAAGALDPDTGDLMRNNMSVEGKVVSPSPAVATDGNTIELRLPPSQDAYLLHGLVLSEVVRPRLEVTMTADPPVALPGETVTFTTTVTNASTDTMLPDVRLEYPTPGFSGCDKPIGWLQPGQSVSWTCSTVAGARGLTVQARGSSRYGSTNVAVDVAEAGFRVAGMQLSQTISPAVVASGAPVTLSSTVTNSGDAPATDVRVGHPNLPDCDTPVIASLAAGESTSVSCTTPAPAASFRGAGTGTWRSGGRRFTVGANETALSVIHPGVSVAQTVAPEQVHPGEDAEFTTTLHNTGDGELRDVHVAFSLTPSCPGTDLETLARDETVTITCGWTAGETGGANDVTVTATDTAGLPFSASFPGAAVRVVSPTLAVSQTVEPAEVRAGEEVTVTYTVRHTGDAADGPVTDLTVHSEQLPSCAPDPVPSMDPGASVTLTCVVTPEDTVETVPRVSGTDALGAEVTATGEPATITVVAPELTVARTATPQTVRVGGSTEVEFTVTNSGDETDGAITGVTLADAGLADCTIAPLGDLAPGESATASCTLEPQASLTSTPVATGTDRFGEPVTASAEPLLIQLIDPKLEISVVADPTEVEPGDEVRFTVVVRNVGDVLLRVEVTNDPARDCDLLIPPERDEERDDEGGLMPGAAQSQKCTMNAPDEEGPFLDTATYSALPSGVVDPGEPLTGVAHGTVQVTDDPSNGPGGENPGGGGGSGGGSGDLGDGFRGGGDSFGSGSGGGGSGSGSGSGSGGDLAYTGASLLGPLAAGLGLLLVGALALLVSRAGRRRAP